MAMLRELWELGRQGTPCPSLEKVMELPYPLYERERKWRAPHFCFLSPILAFRSEPQLGKMKAFCSPWEVGEWTMHSRIRWGLTWTLVRGCMWPKGRGEEGGKMASHFLAWGGPHPYSLSHMVPPSLLSSHAPCEGTLFGMWRRLYLLDPTM